MDLQQLPVEALEAELKRRKSAQLAEYRAKIREHEQAIQGLEQQIRNHGQPINATRRRKASA